MGHNGAYDDGNEHTGQDEEAAKVADVGKESVHKEHDATAQPCADDEAHEDMPRLFNVTGMHEGVHGDSLLAEDG